MLRNRENRFSKFWRGGGGGSNLALEKHVNPANLSRETCSSATFDGLNPQRLIVHNVALAADSADLNSKEKSYVPRPLFLVLID